MEAVLGGTFATDCGMLCLWDPATFAGVTDHECWENELCENKDLGRHIKAGSLVPVNTDRGIDGAFAVILRVGNGTTAAGLTEREGRHILGESKPYLFRSSGRICLSGLEHVEGKVGRAVGCIPIPEGDHVVKVYFIAWDDEPGMKDSRGRPKPGALPDFVVLVDPKGKRRIRFRTKVHALEPYKES